MEPVSVSDDEKRMREHYILYCFPNDEPCKKAVYAAANAEILQQTDVYDIQTLQELPPWLDGVPWIVDTNTKTGYKGTDCLEFIQSKRRPGRIPIIKTSPSQLLQMSLDAGSLGMGATKDASSLESERNLTNSLIQERLKNHEQDDIPIPKALKEQGITAE
jgi:hypothetical protein